MTPTSPSSPSWRRVALVGKGAPERGGIPTFVEVLRTGLADAGVEVELVNLASGTPRAGGRASVENLVAMVRDARRARRAGAANDVVHVHSACAPGTTLVRAGALCAAARAAGAATVLHVHGGLVADWLTTPVRRRLARQVLRGADAVVAVADGPARQMAAALGRPVPVIGNGVDTDAFCPPPRRDDAAVPTVVFVGGLTPRKGVLDLLAASDALIERGLEHRLVLAGGTSDDGSDTEARVRAAVQRQHVDVVPPRPHDQMPMLYRDAEVFCLPSWWEAQPLSLLEAMACGCACVVSDVGDVVAMTDGGRAARVVPVRDVDALIEALAAVVGDGEERRRLGVAGRDHVIATRGLGHMLDEIRDAYGRAVACRKGSNR